MDLAKKNGMGLGEQIVSLSHNVKMLVEVGDLQIKIGRITDGYVIETGNMTTYCHCTGQLYKQIRHIVKQNVIKLNKWLDEGDRGL